MARGKSSKDLGDAAMSALAKSSDGGQYAAALINSEAVIKDQKRTITTLQDREDQLISDHNKELKAWAGERAMRIAGAASGGFATGAAVAYFADPFVVAKLGNGIMSLLLIPGIGVLMSLLPSQIKDTKTKSQVETRAGVYGASIGLVLMGGYMSYQRWT